MKKNNFTYILLGGVVGAIAISVILYANVQHSQSQIQPVSLTEPTINSADPVVPVKASVLAKNTSSTIKSTKVTTPPVPVPNSKTTPAPTPVTTVPPPAPVIIATPISLPYDVINFSPGNVWRAVIGAVGLKFVDGAYKRNFLTVSSTTSTDGIAELPGSEGWSNYQYTLNTNFISGPAFALIGRYTDNKNYVKCIYSQGGVTRIDAIISGKTSTINQSGEQLPTIPDVSGVDYSMKVNKNDVTCLVNNSGISATIPTMPSVGGIGVDVYNSTPGSSQLNIQEIHVSAL